MNNRKKFTLFILFVLFCVIVAIISGYIGFNLSYLEKTVSANYFLSIFIYFLLFVILVSLSFSVWAMIFAGIIFFPVLVVAICAMAGIMGGAITHYFIAQKLGKEYVRNYLEKKGGKLEKFDEILEKDNFKTIFIFSAAFIVPPIIPNLLGGIMKINLKNYSIATFIGNFPNAMFMIYFAVGIIYSKLIDVYISVAGITIVTILALYFYKGELKHIFIISFPWMFRKQKA
jgi:uncharacterized membrane protein YdjX (TVP38/TMEM64 family)